MKRSRLILFILLFCLPSHITLITSQADNLVSKVKEQKDFQKFLEKRELGVLDEKGIWWFEPPATRSDRADVINLAYGLEWYKIYAERKKKSPLQLGLDIGINGFNYGKLEMKKGVFFKYQGSDVFTQSEILREQLKSAGQTHKGQP